MNILSKHNNTLVYGIDLDPETRCAHYHSIQDIVAILFNCCQQFYACIECHNTLEAHAPTQWQTDQYQTKAILCGHCGTILTIEEYLNCKAQCPNCQAAFNPNCSKHYDCYFK